VVVAAGRCARHIGSVSTKMKFPHWKVTALWVAQFTMEKRKFFVKWNGNEIVS
jgi:hypothetical protein